MIRFGLIVHQILFTAVLTVAAILCLIFSIVSCTSKTVLDEQPADDMLVDDQPTVVAVHATGAVDNVIVAVGETVAVPIKLLDVGVGLSGYDITISLATSEVALIVDLAFPDFGLVDAGELPADSVRIRAVDLNDMIPVGTQGITILTIEVQGVTPGSTDLIVNVTAMDDDEGNPVLTNILSSRIDVSPDGTSILELFFDDFDDGNDEGWGHELGNWEIVAGEYTATDESGYPMSSILNRSFGDFVFEGDLRINQDGVAHIGFRVQEMNTSTGWPYDGIVLVVYPGGNSVYWHVVKNDMGDAQAVMPIGITVSEDNPLHVKVIAINDSLDVYINGVWKSRLSTTEYSSGKIFLGINLDYPTTATWDNIKISIP